jgi:hypothetical protein
MRASSGAWRARHRWRSTPARGQVPPILRARCPAVPTASYHRLSVSTATVSVSMVAGRILAAWRSWRATVDEDGHYSFAVPLGCRSPPCAPIGSFATPCDLALRLVGGRPAGIATWSAYPSIAAAPINPRIDVMGQLRKKSGGKFATADLLRRLFDATLFPQLTAFVGIGCQSAHDNPGRIRGTAGGPPHPRLHLPWSRLGQQRKLPAPSVKFSRSGPRDQSASPARYAIWSRRASERTDAAGCWLTNPPVHAR